MDKTALVGLDIERGSRILQILDEAGLQVDVAMWAFLSDYDDWRLVLSSRKLDNGPRGGYTLYHKALDAAGVEFEETPVTVILNSKSRFIGAVRKKFEKSKRVKGTRIYMERLGDRFADEAYVYRA
jgi:hypothetical protein